MAKKAKKKHPKKAKPHTTKSLKKILGRKKSNQIPLPLLEERLSKLAKIVASRQ